MLEPFLNYISENSLLAKGDKILITVSGGIDSVTLAQLCYEAGYAFGIAHCNFQLRGKESDEDEAFVRQLASQYGVSFYLKKFDTHSYCVEKKISIQMGARELRYAWFDEIAREEGYNCIAVAHNRDDIAETILLNLIRGTGLKGLTGIKAKSGLIIRPLLFAPRDEIRKYAADKGLSYREDSSNKETKYHRNLIRSEIIPLMEKINPSFSDTLIRESGIFNATWQIYQKEVDTLRNEVTKKDGPVWKMSIAKIQSLRISHHVLHDMLSPYSFNMSVVRDIFNSLDAEVGRQFHSDEYTLIRDRHFLLIEKKSTEEEGEYSIEKDLEELTEPVSLLIQKIERDQSFKIPSNPGSAALDLDKLQFPLKLRHWQDGDYFIPLGMKGKKKLSDFFIDRKISLPEKKRIWLLTSGEDIVWIMGKQIDERYKVTAQTQKILFLTLAE